MTVGKDIQSIIDTHISVIEDFKASESRRIFAMNEYLKGDAWSQVEGENESKAFPLTADDEQKVNIAAKSIMGKIKQNE